MMLVPAEFPPRPALAQYVQCLWTLKGCVESDTPENQSAGFKQFLPDAGLKISFNRERSVEFVLPDGRYTTDGQGCLCGVLTQNYWIHYTGRINRIGVRFHPGCAYAFVPFSVERLNDRICDLDQIWGRAGWELTEDMQCPKLTTPQRIERLENFLIDLLDRYQKHDSVYGSAAQAVITRQGQVSLGNLSRRVGSSRRQLERKFRRKSGLTPKQFCRILRFRHLFEYISAHPNDSWVVTALACGYYDQAHLIRDFRQFTGMSPVTFIKEIVQKDLLINWGYDMDALARFGLGIPL